jgi:hypothetical protein
LRRKRVGGDPVRQQVGISIIVLGNSRPDSRLFETKVSAPQSTWRGGQRSCFRSRVALAVTGGPPGGSEIFGRRFYSEIIGVLSGVVAGESRFPFISGESWFRRETRVSLP